MGKQPSKNVLLANRTQQIGWDLHSFAGIFIGLPLFLFFYGGAFSLFLHDMHEWTKPAERVPYAGKPASIDALIAPILESYDLTGQTLQVGVPTPAHPTLTAFLRQEGRTVAVDPRSGTFIEEQDSSAGDLLYRLHFLNILPGGERAGVGYFVTWGTAGIVSLIAVAAILTGLLIYLPRIKLDIFRFRHRTKGRRRWLDAHNVIGTMSLPFALILSFTGAMICVGHVVFFILQPAMGELRAQGPSGDRFGGDRQPEIVTMAPANIAARIVDPAAALAVPSVDPFVRRAQERWPQLPVRAVAIHDVGSPDSIVSVVANDELKVVGGASELGEAQIFFRARTGEVLEVVEPEPAYSLSSTLWQLMIVLHYGAYGGALLKPLYFLLALAFGFAILAGNMVWTRSRRGVHPQRVPFYDRIDRLTVGIGAGILPATAALFLANKAVPMDLASRGALEETVFWLSWLLALAFALTVREPARSLRVLLMTGGVVALLLPIANGIVTGDWLWTSASSGLVGVFWFDATALALGTLMLFASTRIPADGARVADRNQRPRDSVQVAAHGSATGAIADQRSASPP